MRGSSYALRFSLFLVMLLSMAVGAAAQQTPAGEDVNGEDYYYGRPAFGVGINASLFSGAGLAGRMTFPGGFAAQAAFFVITVGEYAHFNIGGEVEYSLIRKRDWRLYGLLGMGYYRSTSDDTTKPGNRIAEPFRTGLGLGYEWFAGEQFVVCAGGAITYFAATGKVLPTPEVGMFFYFR